LQAIVDRVETVKSEHEKLEGGNKFLQSYVITLALHPYIYTNLFSGTLVSSCKHPESHPPRHPKRVRVALEESKGQLLESLLFDICVIMLQHAAASMAEHRLPTQPCVYFMALGIGIGRKRSWGVHGVLSLFMSTGPGCSCVMRELFRGRFREDTRKFISAITHELPYSIVE
jgi:hypothetical protein